MGRSQPLKITYSLSLQLYWHTLLALIEVIVVPVANLDHGS